MEQANKTKKAEKMQQTAPEPIFRPTLCKKSDRSQQTSPAHPAKRNKEVPQKPGTSATKKTPRNNAANTQHLKPPQLASGQQLGGTPKPVGSARGSNPRSDPTKAVGERLPTRSSIKNRWKSYCSESLDTQVFASMLTDLAGEVNPESMTEKVMSKVQEACDASMRSRRPYNRHHEPVYWWTESIADARRVCIRARRRYQRSRGRPTFLEHQATFQSARRTLKKAIRDSKRKCFLDLCDAAEHDPWGRAYKIVAKKLNANGNSVPSDPLSMRRIVEHLFPTCSESGGLQNTPLSQSSSMPIEEVTPNEMLWAAATIGVNKAPGPDYFATEQKMPAKRSKAVRPKGHDQEELPELHADEGTITQMGVVLEALTVWFNSQRYITTLRKEEIIQLSCLQKLAMDLCTPDLASTEVQTTPTVGAAVSMRNAAVKKATGMRAKNGDTPKRQRDPAWELRKTPPKRSKSHDKNMASHIEAGTQSSAVVPREDAWTKVTSRRVRNAKPDAILVKGVGSSTYADLLKTVKTHPGLKDMSNDVQGIRKTENGSLVLRLSRSSTHGIQEITQAVENALGERAEVKRLTEQAQLEIRDLDDLTTKEDICEAFSTKEESIRLVPADIKGIRKSYGGTQIATLLVAATFRVAIGDMSVSGTAEEMAQQAVRSIKQACDASMQRTKGFRRHEAVYWWTEHIAKARAECIKARRAYSRARGTEAYINMRTLYTEKRRTLKKAIKDQKRLSFIKLCEEADRDPWGQAYKLVMKKTSWNEVTQDGAGSEWFSPRSATLGHANACEALLPGSPAGLVQRFQIAGSLFQTNTALAVPILAARAAGNTGGKKEHSDEQAIAKSKKINRTPPSSSHAPSSAPPRIAEGVFVFSAAGSKDETP
ncbi:hypothetical protein ACLKA6_005684 [Drosophila palustris]